MFVFLVNPSQVEVYGKMKAPQNPPLGLAYLGAVLEKAGHRVEIIDMDAEGLSPERLSDEVRERQVDVVGVTTVSPSYHRAVDICHEVKQASPRTVTVLGGIHPTLVPGESAEPPSVDFCVKGEAEETAVEWLEALEGKRSFSSVRGLVYKDGGKPVQTDLRPLVAELDTLPFPAWHLFRQFRYEFPDALEKPTYPIFTSRGCPANCTYCMTKQIFTRRFRARSAQNVVDEIEFLVRRLRAREIHIWDDNFPTQKKRVLEIRDELRRRDLRVGFAFPNGMRADYVNEETLRAIKEMGAYSIAYGVESGNERILKGIEKGESLDRVRETFRLMKKVRLESWGFFMVGLPGEDRSTILDTIRFAKELDPDVAKFHVLEPYPGSKVFYQLLEQGLITNFDYANYGTHTAPVHRLPTLSGEDILRWQKRAYREFYLRPQKILRHIFRRTTWNRLRVNVRFAFGLLKLLLGGALEKRYLGEFDQMGGPVPSSVKQAQEGKRTWSDEFQQMRELERGLPPASRLPSGLRRAGAIGPPARASSGARVSG